MNTQPVELIVDIIKKTDNIDTIIEFCKSDKRIKKICYDNRDYISRFLFKNNPLTKNILLPSNTIITLRSYKEFFDAIQGNTNTYYSIKDYLSFFNDFDFKHMDVATIDIFVYNVEKKKLLVDPLNDFNDVSDFIKKFDKNNDKVLYIINRFLKYFNDKHLFSIIKQLVKKKYDEKYILDIINYMIKNKCNFDAYIDELELSSSHHDEFEFDFDIHNDDIKYILLNNGYKKSFNEITKYETEQDKKITFKESRQEYYDDLP